MWNRHPAGPETFATLSRRRIAAELAKLGHDVSKDTVARYMPKRPRRPGRPPSTTWGTFLRTHPAPGTLAVDFLTVPSVTFDVLYVFFVLSLERRRILPVNVTAHPHAGWTAQQVVEAVGPDGEVVRLIPGHPRPPALSSLDLNPRLRRVAHAAGIRAFSRRQSTRTRAENE